MADSWGQGTHVKDLTLYAAILTVYAAILIAAQGTHVEDLTVFARDPR